MAATPGSSPSPHAVAWPEVWRAERERIVQRRAALGLPPLPDAPTEAPPSHCAALALSGGGVRSATFSLGLMQGLARHRVLESFDYLSTVSGGGYIGAFFCSLFHGRDGRPAVAPTEPYDVLRGNGAKPGADDPKAAGWQLWWLRNSGAYLAPTGAGDYLYAVAMALRNLVAVHYVIGVAVLLTLLLLMAVDGLLRQAAQALGVPAPTGEPGLGLLVWAGLSAALWLVPAALAYFATEMPSPRRGALGQRLWWLNGTGAVMTLLGLGGLLVAGLARAGHAPALLSGGALAFAAIVFIALGLYVATALLVQRGHYVPGGRAESEAATPQGRMLSTRVALTKWLATALKATLLTAACAAVLGLGTVVTRLAETDPVRLPFTWGGVSLLLVGAVKKGASTVSKLSVPDWLRRWPLDLLALAGAAVLSTLLLLGWCSIVWSALSLLQIGWATLGWPFAPAFLQLVGAVLVLNLATAYCFQFVNLSSIQNLYASRLVRAYLGASNPVRAHLQASRWTRLSDTHPQDNLSLTQYYDAALHPPLHVVNTTLNETVSPLDPLVQRDRHGRPLAVSPDHLCIDGRWHRRDEPPGRALRPGSRPPEAMSIGSWIGVSGAAFSTGIGRGTSLGKSLLLGLANVRLGHWWRAGVLKSAVPAAAPPRGVLAWAGLGLAALFQPQAYLLAELLGRFRGSYARYWYLSDGGHFENTGLYELLRRRVGLVIASDNGADPDYQHDDLANLMRLARLDFGCEFRRLDAAALQRAGGDAAALAPLLIDDTSRGRGQGSDDRCISVFWAARPGEPLEHGTALVVVKPRLVQGAPLDVRQYAQAHGRFPQEPTTDQFFSEEQWESYRKLGDTLGSVLFRSAGGPAGERLPALRTALLEAARITGE